MPIESLVRTIPNCPETGLMPDDLVAAGGTAEAAAALVEKAGGSVGECCVVIALPDIGGRGPLQARGYPVHALCQLKGE